jgi:hypothetical protein
MRFGLGSELIWRRILLLVGPVGTPLTCLSLDWALRSRSRPPDGIVKVIARHTQIHDLSWHSFRHTWAEALADDLLNQYLQQAFQIIRDLGGWKPGSTVPMHYIQNALRKRGIDFLRERNSILYLNPEER